MVRQILALLCLPFAVTAYGQKPHGQAYIVSETTLVGPEPVIRRFPFSNGKLLAVSYFPNLDMAGNNEVISEFTLYEYGKNTPLMVYGAVETCKVSFANDTLFIERMELLPVGKDHSLVDTAWLTEKWFYNSQSKPVKAEVLSSHFNCDEATINATVTDYLSTRWKTQIETHDEKEAEAMMNLAARLMLISTCEDGKYLSYFKDFSRRFRPDGAYAEWYSTMALMIQTARRLQKQ